MVKPGLSRSTFAVRWRWWWLLLAIGASAGCGDDEDPEFPPIVTPEPPRTTPPLEPDPCHDEATYAACQACVEKGNEGGAEYLRTQYVQACACGDQTPCAEPCEPPRGALCASIVEPSTECQACLDALPAEDAACVSEAFENCQAEASCAALLSSLRGCPTDGR